MRSREEGRVTRERGKGEKKCWASIAESYANLTQWVIRRLSENVRERVKGKLQREIENDEEKDRNGKGRGRR